MFAPTVILCLQLSTQPPTDNSALKLPLSSSSTMAPTTPKSPPQGSDSTADGQDRGVVDSERRRSAQAYLYQARKYITIQRRPEGLPAPPPPPPPPPPPASLKAYPFDAQNKRQGDIGSYFETH